MTRSFWPTSSESCDSMVKIEFVAVTAEVSCWDWFVDGASTGASVSKSSGWENSDWLFFFGIW